MNVPGFDRELQGRIERALRPGQVIETLGLGKPNRIVEIGHEGVFVQTERSDDKGTGPQLIPAWMIAAGWDHLRQRGHLSQQELLETLKVKRSAFVCALLALFDGVKVQ